MCFFMVRGQVYDGLHAEMCAEKAALVYLFLQTDRRTYNYQEIAEKINELWNHGNTITKEHLESFVQAVYLKDLRLMDFMPRGLEKILNRLRGDNGESVS